MIKENKWKILLSSLITLAPMLFGVIVWDALPEQIAIHWGLSMETDSYGSIGFVVFGIPLILFALNLLCLFGTMLDKRHLGQNKKVFGMIFFIMPCLSLYINGIVYATAYGLDLDMSAIITLLLGVMLLFIGNYMPKCKQNFTMGIKVKWTLANEENWNKTHRFAGKIWFFGGIAMILLVFVPAPVSFYAAVALILPLVLAPILYSYLYYKRQLKQGRYLKEDFILPVTKGQKTVAIVVTVLMILILAGCIFLLFSGDVTVVYGEKSFTLEATYHDDLTVAYSDIEDIEFRTENVKGERLMGFGSPRLMLGTFRNDEFGPHTRYTYTDCEAALVMTVKGKTLVINGKTLTETKAIYDTLLEKTGK